MRFDRDVTSLEDFDAATKGIFLCGDFTNRNALVELADPDNLDSGSGFSDSKSGPGQFPTGPFLVIPKDWETFVADIRMTTSLNGEPRQDARGGEMTMSFRELTQQVLGDMSEARFLYKGGYELMAPSGAIDSDMTLMSGTSEGVIFTSPTRGDAIGAVIGYALSGGPFGGTELMDSAKATFIANELASGHFLQPGDRVRHGSSYLGNIHAEVTAPE
ncbi:MAG: fumarylacetoacetate hydrolase family protein [Pseudomonadota bacterium]